MFVSVQGIYISTTKLFLAVNVQLVKLVAGLPSAELSNSSLAVEVSGSAPCESN
ncbi:MAG: hypothetical protein ACTSRG_14590 [Candidatus Helarchaeota archaeon]